MTRLPLLAALLLGAATGASAFVPAYTCTQVCTVKQGGGAMSTTISGCVTTAQTASPLSSDYCIDIQDSATYTGQVVVSGINANGHQLVIGPQSPVNHPILDVTNRALGFSLQVASTAVVGMQIVDNTNLTGPPFAIGVAAPNVNISSVIVNVAATTPDVGVQLGSWGSLSYSTVNVLNTMAVYMSSALGTSISSCVISNQSGGAPALVVWQSTGIVVGQSGISNGAAGLASYAVQFSSGMGNVLVQSTAAGAGIGLRIVQESADSVAGSYVQGSTAVYVLGSTSTLIGGSVLVATNAGGIGVFVTSGSVNVNVSSNVITGGSLGAGVSFDANLSGALSVSTNLVQGALIDLYVLGPAPAETVWVTSNTFLPIITSNPSPFAYAIDVNGLASGATFYNNNIFYRTAGSGINNTQSAIGATASSGLVFHHNRIDAPSVFGAGTSVAAIAMNGVTQTGFKFNDVSYACSGLNNVSMLSLTGSTVAFRDNIVDFSCAGTGTTVAMYNASATSGLDADYNDLNGTASFVWGGTFASLASWQGTGRDAHSFAAAPLFASVAAGAEDFHPQSTVGRWNQALQNLSLVDGAQSPTIDAGDPLEPFSNEPPPNGGRVNQGSYGNTPQASLSAFPGCAYLARVSVAGGQPFSSINSAVASLPHAPTALTGRACVVVEDSGNYYEQVNVSGFNNGVSSITIFVDAGFAPTVFPPAGSTAAFVVSNASVSIAGINIKAMPGSVPYGIYASSGWLQVSSVTISTNGSNGIYAAGIQMTTYSWVSAVSVQVADAYALAAFGPGNLVSGTFGNGSQTREAVAFVGAASGTVVGSWISNQAGSALGLNAASNFNVVSFSTAISYNNNAEGLHILASSGNVVSKSYAYSQGGSAIAISGGYGNAVSGSTAAAVSTGTPSIYVVADSETITDSLALSQYGSAVWLKGYLNTLRASTVTASGAASPALTLNGSSSTVTRSLVVNSNGTTNAIAVRALSSWDLFDLSVASGGIAVSANGSTGLQVSRSFLYATNIGLNAFGGAAYTSVAQTTIAAAGYYAAALAGVSATTISNSYLSSLGAGGVVMYSATATTLGGDVFSAAAGPAVWSQSLNGSNVGLWITSSTVLPGSQSGFQLDANSVGRVEVSSNVVNFDSGGSGLKLSTAAAGTTVLVSSNIFLPNLATNLANTALQINGLQTGATIQYNDFYYRNSGGNGAGGFATISAISASGLTIHHNRIDESMLTSAASYQAVRLVGAASVAFKYNDVLVNTPAAVLQAALVMVSSGSTGVGIEDNVFSASLNGSTTATLFVDVPSQPGFYANYNDYFNPSAGGTPAPGAVCGNAAVPLGGPWVCGGPLLDGSSFSLDPLWFSTSAGAEDFHPKSTVGRWNPGSNGFSVDAVQAPTVDAGDPNDDFSLEPGPSGSRVNIGSYGDTPEASKSVTPLGYPGCVNVTYVGRGQWYGSIQGALNSLPSALTNDQCIVITDTATYVEAVNVSGFTGGHRVTIEGSNQAPPYPAVSPPGGAAAFDIANASVTLRGIAIAPTQAISYGVRVSSSYVQIASVTVNDSLGKILNAAVVLASSDTLTASTVTTASGAGAWLQGMGSLVSASSIAVANNVIVEVSSPANTLSGLVLINASNIQNAVKLDAAATATQIVASTLTARGLASGLDVFSGGNLVTGSVLNAPSGDALLIEAGAGGNAVVGSTLTTQGGAGAVVFGATTTFAGDVFTGLGFGFEFQSSETSGTVRDSAVNATYGNGIANTVYGSVNTFLRDVIVNSGGLGLNIVGAGAFNNSIVLSSVTGGGTSYALQVNGGASSNTVSQSFLGNANAAAATFVGGSSNTVSQCVLSAANQGLLLDGGEAYMSVFGSTIAGGNLALYLNNAAWAKVVQTSVTSTGNSAIYVNSLSANNLIQNSTATSNLAATVYVLGSSTTFDRGVVTNGGAVGVQFAAGSSNMVTNSLVPSVADAGVGDQLSGDFINAPSGIAVDVTGAKSFVVTGSTIISPMASGLAGLRLTGASAATVSSSYILGNTTAAVVSGSTATLITATTLAGGAASVWMTGGSVGLALRGDTLQPYGSGDNYGVLVDSANGGVIDLSTNVFASGPSFLLAVSSPSANATVWIASNTFFPLRSAAAPLWGAYLVGVASATVRNNSLYYRGADAGGAAPYARVAFHAENSPYLTFDHNRVNDPGVVGVNPNPNDFTGAELFGSPYATIKFNDFDVQGGLLHASALLALRAGSTSARLRDNVFYASLGLNGVSPSSATLIVDGASAAGFASDYNDFFSAGPLDTVVCAGAAASLTASYLCGGAPQDAHSIAGDPLWVSVGATAEFFVVKSQGGRCIDPACSGTQFDLATSPTIDAADPAEPYNLEPGNNGYRANQGSYGDTAFAAQTLPPPAPCAVARKVCKTGACPNSTIQGALASLPNPLVGTSCVLLEDSAAYLEAVTVSGFDNTAAGYRLYITSDPAAGLAAPATIQPQGAVNAALTVQNASVTVMGVNVYFNGGSGPYGIRVSSPSVLISSVVVGEIAADISVAGVALSSYDAVEYSTIDVQTANGIYADGTGDSVLYSTVSKSVGSAGTYGVYLNGASSATLTGVSVVDPLNTAVYASGAPWTRVSLSSFSSPSNSSWTLFFNPSQGVAVSSSYVSNGGNVAVLSNSGPGFSMTASTVALGTGGLYAIRLTNGSGDALANDYVYSAAGGIQLLSESNPTLSGVTVVSASTAALNIYNTANAQIVGSSITAASSGVELVGSAGGNSIVGSTVTSLVGGGFALKLEGRLYGPPAPSGNLFLGDVFRNPAGVAGYFAAVASNTVALSTFTGATGGVALVGASTTTFLQDYVVSSGGIGAQFDAASASNTIAGSTLAALGAASGSSALYWVGATSNSLVGSVVYGGAWLDSGAAYDTIFLSTMIGGTGVPALHLQTASSNTVRGGYLYGAAKEALNLGGGTLCVGNAVVGSTMVAAGGAGTVFANGTSPAVVWADSFVGDVIAHQSQAGMFLTNVSSLSVVGSTLTSAGSTPTANPLFMQGASSVTVSGSYLANLGGGSGSSVQTSGGPYSANLFLQDQFFASNSDALLVNGQLGGGVSGSLLVGSNALELQNTNGFAVTASTLTSPGGGGLWVRTTTSTLVTGSYVQGAAQAVWVTGSTGTAVVASTLAATGSGGQALLFTGGSNGLSVTTSAVYGPANGYGVYVDSAIAGAIVVATDTFQPGPIAELFVGTNPTAGVTVSVTSNTFLPTLSATANTYGMLFQGGVGALTVRQNDILYRTPMTLGAAVVAYGAMFEAVASPAVDHNRVSEPGMVSGGGFVAWSFQGSFSPAFKFNDLYATGSGLAVAQAVQLANSASAVVRDDAFSFNMTQSFGHAVILSVDVPSETGFSNDYNDDYVPASNVNANTARWGALNYNLGAGWSSTSGGDTHSFDADPMYVAVGAGTEDFHPLSTTGRYSPALGVFVSSDVQNSPTIDAGDPAEPFALEPQPNDGRANQGSYGDTGQASKTSPPPGCGVEYTVAPGFYATIGNAIAAVKAAAPLTMDTCVIIRYNGAVFGEEVDVSGIATNNHRLTIMGGANMNPLPTVDGGGQTVGAFNIANASVTVRSLNVVASAATPYAVYAGSANVTVTSVTASGSFTTAAVWLSSAATISFSSVTSPVNGAVIAGGGATVLNSSFVYTGAMSSPLPLSLAGASSSTVSGVYASGGQDAGAWLSNASNLVVSQSSFTSFNGRAALVLDHVYGSTVTTSYMAGGNWAAGVSLIAGGGNTVSYSTAVAASSVAFHSLGSSSNTIAWSTFLGATDGLELVAGSNANSLLNVVSSGDYAGGWCSAVPNGVPAAGAGANAGAGAVLSYSDRNLVAQSSLGGGTPSAACNNYLFGGAGLAVDHGVLTSVTGSSLSGGRGNSANATTTGCSAGGGGDGASVNSSSNAFANSVFQGGPGGGVTTSALCGGAAIVAFGGGIGLDLVSVNANGNSVSQSTMTGGAGGTVQRVGDGAGGAGLAVIGGTNTATLSVMTGGAGGSNYVAGPAGGSGGAGAYLYYQSYANQVTLSVLTGGVGGALSAGGHGAYLLGASSASFTSSVLTGGSYGSGAASGGGHGVFLATSPPSPTADTISLSTAVGAQDGYGVYAMGAASLAVLGGYVQGSTAAVFNACSATRVDSTVLVATNTSGIGLEMTNASSGLQLTQSAVTAGLNAAAVFIDGGQGGAITIATNTISSPSFIGVFVATPAAGATVRIASNTVLMNVSPGAARYGLYLDGLAGGATIQYNSFYYRFASPAALGAAHTGPIYADTSPGLVIDHNRFSMSGALTSGNYDGVRLVGSAQASIRFNDFYGASAPGGSLTSAYLLQLALSPSVRVRDNVFASSFTVSGASATIALDMSSIGGYQADYNAYFSSSTRPTILWAGVQDPFPWYGAVFQDQDSTGTANPRWPGVAAGAEDFHPLSQAGRWSPAAASWIVDSWTAATLDAADPAEPFANEPANNGSRANLGSYGNTAEASKTPPAPTSPAVAAVYSSSVTVSFGIVSAQGQIVGASLNPSLTPAITSGPVAGLSALSPQGLAPNTTYYLGAGAYWGDLLVVSPVTLSTVTLAVNPAPLGSGASSFVAVGVTSATVVWSNGGNPANVTQYTVVIATTPSYPNSDAADVSQSTTPFGATPTASFGAGQILANTTIYAFVSAVNQAGQGTPFVLVATTVTSPAAPTGVIPTFVAVSSASATVHWGANGNPLGLSTYTVQLSTDPFFANVTASSATLSTAPVSLPPTATLSGLLANTTYFFRVQTIGANGSTTAFFQSGSTSTLAAPPVLQTFSAAVPGQIGLTWSASGNPPGTQYVLQTSPSPSFAGLVTSSATYSLSASTAGLPTNTTFYFQLAAVNNAGVSTPFVSSGAVATLANPPATLASTFTAVYAASMTVQWAANGNPPGTVYFVQVDTASDFSGAASVQITTAPSGANPSATLNGLASYTVYYLRVEALSWSGTPSTFVQLGSTQTTTPSFAPPSVQGFTSVSTYSLTATWTLTPGATGYLLDASLSPANPPAAVVASSQPVGVAATTATLAGLLPNTTYFVFLQALGPTAASPFAAYPATSTLAAVPVAVVSSVTMVGTSSVTVNWGANGNPIGVTTYTVVASTAADFNAFASSVTLSTAPSGAPCATLTGLAMGATWYFEARAVNSNGVPTAYAAIASTYSLLGGLVPVILDYQAGDAVWRSSGTATYDVRFQDGSTTHLDKFLVKASTTPGGAGADLIAFTTVTLSMSPLDAYAVRWALPPAVWNALLEGVTNYVTVRVYNNVPSSATLQDAFYVLKDTTPPTVVNNAAGLDPVVRSSSGTLFDVRAKDLASGLGGFQYSASLTRLSGDASLVGWTDIGVTPGATSYATPWSLSAAAFAALPSGVTSYVSVRAWDVAANTTTVVDAFYVLKDTAGPAVTISSPAVGAGYVSAVGTIRGASASPFGVQGDEVAVLDVGSSLYWNPGGAAFNAATPIWMIATGTTTWSLNAPIAFQDGKAYKIVARSSTTFNFYSTAYATAAFVADFSTPTVGVQAPVPNSTVSSLPVISGTALDPGAAASGLSGVEVRLERLSDGKWWNWFTQAWTSLPVSTVPTGTASWSVTPTPLLQANLLTNASYYVAVRASDNAAPPNTGDFFQHGATFTYSNPTPPAAVTDLGAVSGILSGQVQLSWHATGENGSAGIVLQGVYAIFAATSPSIAPSTATAAVLFSTSNIAPGAPLSYTLGGLTAGVTYWLQVALQNTDGNWSAFSNQTSTTATPAPFNAIMGHVVDASTNGITGVEVDAWNAAGALVSTAFTLADGSGTYTVGGLTPGVYKLQATWTVNGVRSSVWQDSIPMGSYGVDFSLSINYALATLTGSLASLTTASARAATTPADVLRPSGAASYVEVSQLGRAITKVGVPPSGRWTVPHLLPGTYSVRAFTGVTFTDAQTVTLLEGETKQVNFAFDSLPSAAVFAFPNPARNATRFRFITPFQQFEALIDVFDIAGRLVKEIPGSAMVPENSVTYYADWDLTNSRGQAVASGVYLFSVKVKGNDGSLVKVVKKLAVVR